MQQQVIERGPGRIQSLDLKGFEDTEQMMWFRSDELSRQSASVTLALCHHAKNRPVPGFVLTVPQRILFVDPLYVPFRVRSPPVESMKRGIRM
jgi:hypothetical protein